MTSFVFIENRQVKEKEVQYLMKTKEGRCMI